MSKNLQTFKDDKGNIIMAQGILPDGTLGIVADEARPFTQEEMEDPAKFKEHRDDLARRVQEDIDRALEEEQGPSKENH